MSTPDNDEIAALRELVKDMPMAKIREIKEKIGLKLWKLVEEGGEAAKESSESEEEQEDESESSSSEDESPKEKKTKVKSAFDTLEKFRRANTKYKLLVLLEKF